MGVHLHSVFCDRFPLLCKARLLEFAAEMRTFFVLIEQPVGSCMFRTIEFQRLQALLGLTPLFVWLGLYGHILLKGTKFLTNLPHSDRLFVCKHRHLCLYEAVLPTCLCTFMYLYSSHG